MDARELNLDCVVEIFLPGAHSDSVPWYRQVTGTGQEIGASLDELAASLEADPLSHRDHHEEIQRCGTCGQTKPGEFVTRYQFQVKVAWPDIPRELGLDPVMWPRKTLAEMSGCLRLFTVALMLRAVATETRAAVVYGALSQAISYADEVLAESPVGRVADLPAGTDDDRHGGREA